MSTTRTAPASTLRARTERGLVWQVLGRGGEQGLRLLANLVLANLLAPEAFGLVGMAAMGLAVADALAFVGTNQAVMADRRGARPRFVATAWAIALVRGVVLGLLLLAVAGPLSAWHGRPDAAPIFAAIAAQPLLAALAHPGAAASLRRLRFGPWTIARLVAVTIGTGVSVGLAISLRSAWALVIGQLATTALISVGSLIVCPRRLRVPPRIHRQPLRRLMRFSLGAVGSPLLLMAIAQTPALLIGPQFGPTVLGVFLLHQRLCDTGRQLVLQAAGFVLLPAASRITHDRARFERAWRSTIRLVSLAALPIAACLAWIGGDLPGVILGTPWHGPEGQFAVLAIGGGFTAIVGICGPMFWALSRPADDRTIHFTRAISAIGLSVALMPSLGPMAVAIAIATSAIVGLLTASWLMWRRMAISPAVTAMALRDGLAFATTISLGGFALDQLVVLTPVTRIVIGALGSLVVVAAIAVPTLVRRHASGTRMATAPGALA